MASLLLALGGAHVARAADPAPREKPILSVEPGGHTARVMRILFRPAKGGRPEELISVGGDKAIRIWRVSEARQNRTLRPHIGMGNRGAFNAAALDPTGRLLAVATFEGAGAGDRVRLFDLDTGRVVRALTHPNNGISDLAFSPDGKMLVACSDRENPAWEWDASTGASLRDLKAAGGGKAAVNRIAFAPDGVSLACAGADGQLRLVRTGDGTTLRSLSCGSEVRSVAWAPVGGKIIAGCQNGGLLLWESGGSASGDPRRVATLANPVTTVAFSPDGALLAAGQGENSADFTARTYDTATGTERAAFRGHQSTVVSLAFTPDGNRVASGDASGAIHLWPATTAGNVAGAVPLQGSGRPIFSVAWSRDPSHAQWVAWGITPDTTGNAAPSLARTFDLASVALGPPPQDASAGAGWQGAVSQAGTRRLVIAEDRLSVQVLENGREVRRLRLSEDRLPQRLPGGLTLTRGQDMDRADEIHAATLSADGTRAFIGSVFSLTEFDTTSGKAVREYAGHTGDITALAVSPDGKRLASASLDQTVRIWTLDTPNAGGVVVPLLSLFEDEQERWIAWTEPGYFAAAPGADRLIGWQVNRGEDEAADFFTADQFWQLFYRPDVLVRVATAGSVATALAQADAVRPDKTDPAANTDNLAALAPPRVEIIGPDTGLTSDAGTFVVRAKISDPNGRKIAEVHTRVNTAGGTARGIGIEAVTPGEVWSRTVSLQPGDNVITVIAENDRGTQSAPTYVHVAYHPAVPPKPRLFLFAVGVSRYTSPAVRRLDYAAKDAVDFADAYRKQQGGLFESVDAVVVQDEEATRTGIEAALRRFAERKDVRPGDYAVIFLAGHGGPLDPRAGRRDYAFYPVDADTARLAATGLPGREVLTELGKIPCNVVLVLDTCREGSGLEIPADDPLQQLRYLTGQVQYGWITVLSCQPNEQSMEKPGLNNGAFTHAFIQGLSGEAARPGEGSISLLDMETYLSSMVPLMTQKKQHPRIDVPSYVTLDKASFPIGGTPRP